MTGREEYGIPVSIEMTDRGRRQIAAQFADTDDDTCWHEVVIDQERIDGIFFGYCPACHESVAATGEENEQGEPGWEVTESMHVSMPFHGHTVSVEVAK